ncbi:hypothetical protein B0J12DRAFT_675549 [Macrophomina phaseolina]|uniref:Proteolipid membrane potential modulator n=1 Tax=Macrophomina phaseolina TaxID=35725 RepID=A0ABQ8G3G9_9PEZI|nr:hypothetical protein B0J12DRAFT_675549 [Macrophomina phaseolina]
MTTSRDIVLYIIAIFLPPVAVAAKRGCSGQVLINIFLDLMGWVPGILHAWYIIATTPDRRKYRGSYYHEPYEVRERRVRHKY